MTTAIGDLSNLELGYALAVLLVASYVRGYSGFGFSAVLVAGLSFVMDPIEAVPLAIVFEILASVVQGQSVWHDIRWRDCALLVLAAVIGNPIGIRLLTGLDQDLLRGGTLLALLLLTSLLLRERAARLDPPSWAIFAVGVFAGIINGATAMSGLVIVLAMSFTVIQPAEIRATLVAYFFASDLFAVLALGERDELTGTLFARAGLGIPLLAIGIFAGTKTFRATSVESFRRATLAMLFAISVVGLIQLAT